MIWKAMMRWTYNVQRNKWLSDWSRRGGVSLYNRSHCGPGERFTYDDGSMSRSRPFRARRCLILVDASLSFFRRVESKNGRPLLRLRRRRVDFLHTRRAHADLARLNYSGRKSFTNRSGLQLKRKKKQNKFHIRFNFTKT